MPTTHQFKAMHQFVDIRALESTSVTCSESHET